MAARAQPVGADDLLRRGLLLLADALGRYRQEHKTLPARVVVYKTSPFDDAELAGFTTALDELGSIQPTLSMSTPARLFRRGAYPPLRGTYVTRLAAVAEAYRRGLLHPPLPELDAGLSERPGQSSRRRRQSSPSGRSNTSGRKIT